jgi:uncharacterized protein YjiS (DUF1127 family)
MHIARVTPPAAPSLTSAPAARPTPPAAASGVWPTWLNPTWLNMVLARRAERQQLLALEERDLRDIGLTPSEAWALAQEPLWRR